MGTEVKMAQETPRPAALLTDVRNFPPASSSAHSGHWPAGGSGTGRGHGVRLWGRVDGEGVEWGARQMGAGGE